MVASTGMVATVTGTIGVFQTSLVSVLTTTVMLSARS